MIKSLKVMAVCLISSIVGAQGTIYLDEDYKPTEKENATYYVVKTEDTSLKLTKVQTFYVDTKTVYREGYVINETNDEKSGTWQWFFKNGNLMSQSTYLEGRILGDIINNYEDGSLRRTHRFDKSRGNEMPYNISYFKDSKNNVQVENGNGTYDGPYIGLLEEHIDSLSGSYVNSKPHGKWYGYKKGAVIFQETYDNGKFVHGIASTGGKQKRYTAFFQKANHDVTTEKFVSKFKTTFYYFLNELSGNNEINGDKITLRFRVSKTGSLEDIVVEDGRGKIVDEAAIRALRALKVNWKPGLLRGFPISSTIGLPIQFATQ